MKKFIIGLICGSVLSISTVVFASDSIQAVLFPSKVSFHVNNVVKEIDGTGDNAILNYKNKSYIPLRTFSEAMGATVTYEAASSATGNLNKIDIYSTSATTSSNDLTLKDPDGYVNIGDLNTTKNQNGSNVISSGTIQVNKDLTGKKIDIDVLDKAGNQIAETDYVYIINEDISPPKVGDIRPFQTNAVYDAIDNGGVEVGSYRVSVHDILKPVSNPDIDKQNGDPLAIMFTPPSQFSGVIPIGKIAPFSIDVYNTSENNLTVKPFDLEFDVYTLDSQNKLGKLVYNYKLPTITGLIASKSGYHVTIPWNQRGTDGKFIALGNYQVQIKTPTTIDYSIEGSSDIKTYNVYLRSSQFGVQFK
jgi:hypothetical protein